MKPRTQPCKKCGATIFFLRTEGKKNWMPLDAKPERRFVMVSETVTNEFGDEAELQVARSVPTFTPHWATCPHADKFRKE
jgi:hypothetical protein